MTKPSIESEIGDYYESLELASERVHAIADAVRFADQARRWKRIAIGMSVALAATLMFAIAISTQSGAKDNDNKNSMTDLKPAAVPQEPVPSGMAPSEAAPVQSASGNVEDSPRPTATLANYRLIAFRSHSNECPHCRATEKTYRELQQDLVDDEIQLSEFDLSDPSFLATTRKRIESQKLTLLIAGRSETAFLALTDSQGNLIREFKPSQGTQFIAKTVRGLTRD